MPSNPETCPRCGEYLMPVVHGLIEFRCGTMRRSDGTLKESEQCQIASLTQQLATALAAKEQAERERDRAIAEVEMSTVIVVKVREEFTRIISERDAAEADAKAKGEKLTAMVEARVVTDKRRGVAIIVQRGSKVLACLRTSCRDMNGCWQFGGGAVEYGETTEQAAYRELYEETGMLARNVTYLCDTHGYTPEGEPMWTSFFTANCEGYEPQNNEPDKHGPWEWVEIEELLSRPIIDVMKPAIAALAAYQSANLHPTPETAKP